MHEFTVQTIKRLKNLIKMSKFKYVTYTICDSKFNFYMRG